MGTFFNSHVRSALLVFVIPVFSIWFFSYAENDLDRKALTELESEIQSKEGTPEKKKEVLEFYRSTPVSEIMASSDRRYESIQDGFHALKLDYAIFHWMKVLGWVCVGTIAVTLLVVGLSVYFSLRSQSAQYYSLRVGWPVLRLSAAVQVLGQAVLLCFLSFWVTAIWFELYSFKLIIFVALIALAGVGALWKAIFAKVSDRCEVEGGKVLEDQAPELWCRIREMAREPEHRSARSDPGGNPPKLFWGPKPCKDEPYI